MQDFVRMRGVGLMQVFQLLQASDVVKMATAFLSSWSRHSNNSETKAKVLESGPGLSQITRTRFRPTWSR